MADSVCLQQSSDQPASPCAKVSFSFEAQLCPDSDRDYILMSNEADTTAFSLPSTVGAADALQRSVAAGELAVFSTSQDNARDLRGQVPKVGQLTTPLPIVHYLDIDHPSLCVAYSFAIHTASSDGATNATAYATSWELQGQCQGSQLWHSLDTRQRTAPHATTDVGAGSGGAVTAFVSPGAMGVFTSFRLIMREVSGSSGSSMSRHMPSLLNTTLSIFCDSIEKNGTATRPVAAWGWTLVLSGPAGQQRLRVRSSDGALDVVSARAVSLHGWRTVDVCVTDLIIGPQAAAQTCHRVAASLCIDNVPIGLLSVAGLFSGERDSDESVVQYAVSQPVPAPIQRMLSPGFSAGLPHTGQCFEQGGACRSGYACTSTPFWLSFARDACILIPVGRRACDADGVRGAQAAGWMEGMRGRIAGMRVQQCVPLLLSDLNDLSLRSAPPGTFLTNFPVRRVAGPLRSIEHVLLWQAGVGADDALIRCKLPCAARYGRTLEAPRASFLDRVGAGARIGHDGPIVLVCHDCGPAVYKEDARAGGLNGNWKRAGERDEQTGIPSTMVAPCTPIIGQSAARQCSISTCARQLPAPQKSEQAGTPARGSIDIGHAYRFEHWAGVDVWVYFSHDRVSIPPAGWIAAAHANGVRVLATILVEWDDGEAALEALLRPYMRHADGSGAGKVGVDWAGKLSCIMSHYGFDGFLVNVEAHASALTRETDGKVPTALRGAVQDCDEIHACAAALVRFLSALTCAVHSAHPNGLVLWYDSIDAASGRVKWCNSVTESNTPFLHACDGIFLNYHWDEALLARTAAAASEYGRSRDVFVGADVWGRGSYGGGQWDTGAAARAVSLASAAVDSAHPLSLALFGPAWTYEAEGGSKDILKQRGLDDRLWVGGEDFTTVRTLHAVPQPIVANPHGLVLTDGQRSVLGSAPAIEAALCSGWRIDDSGGQGWSVQVEDEEGKKAWEGRTCGYDRSDLRIETGPLTCYVTSHAWCRASQHVVFPQGLEAACVGAGAVAPAMELEDMEEGKNAESPFHVTVSEWYRGSGPRFDDAYTLQAVLLDAHGAPIRDKAWDSGVVTCTEQWQQLRYSFLSVPRGTSGVRVTHGGRDTEYWAGHFGARMRGMQVRITPTVPSTEREGVDVVHAGVGGLMTSPGVRLTPIPSSPLFAQVRSAFCAASLPFTTAFACGCGSGMWRKGMLVDEHAWVDHARTDCLPSFPGRLSVAGGLDSVLSFPQFAVSGDTLSFLGGQAADPSAHAAMKANVTMQLCHEIAWEGGSALHVSIKAPHPCTTPTESALALSCVQVRVFACDVPLPTLGLHVDMLCCGTLGGTWTAPALPDSEDPCLLPFPVLVIEDQEGGEGRSLWPSTITLMQAHSGIVGPVDVPWRCIQAYFEGFAAGPDLAHVREIRACVGWRTPRGHSASLAVVVGELSAFPAHQY